MACPADRLTQKIYRTKMLKTSSIPTFHLTRKLNTTVRQSNEETETKRPTNDNHLRNNRYRSQIATHIWKSTGSEIAPIRFLWKVINF